MYLYLYFRTFRYNFQNDNHICWPSNIAWQGKNWYILISITIFISRMFTHHSNDRNRISGVMVSMLTSSAEDHGFQPRSGQTKDYKIGIICCFSAKHAALRSKSKDWLARNQNNVSEWGDMSIRGLLFQWASAIQIQLSVLF